MRVGQRRTGCRSGFEEIKSTTIGRDGTVRAQEIFTCLVARSVAAEPASIGRFSMATCKLCNIESLTISRELGVCLTCIRGRPRDALQLAREAHKRSRKVFGLPDVPPKDPAGLACTMCVNECRIPVSGMGYCGLRRNEGGKLVGVSAEFGKLSWYHDPLPTNCVGDWVCSGCTGAGYPDYAYSPGPEQGYKNLAVFFHACSFNCLYCQNWQFKEQTLKPRTTPVTDLVGDVDDRTSCICYFGGDPTPQLPFALRASMLVRAKTRGRIFRVCWETNGSMHKGFLDQMIKLSLESGGASSSISRHGMRRCTMCSRVLRTSERLKIFRGRGRRSV